ncbi:MAG: septal ring lytic transglycosylase RlpA family protein [Treponema sp.]|jgi:rare lipoprotein A (peptidoglycan hydrolase)|nr:septal ring lytic transglycosylase RlpA family protein [Treponema sp.]
MKRIAVALAAGFFAAVLCGAQNSTAVDLSNYHQEGIASWYGMEFDGRPTASGEIFNSSLYTAAHPTLPFGTQLTVTNLNNGKTVNVRINDRGPFVSSRIIDLSQAAAQLLDMVSSGTAPVRLEIAGGAQGNSGVYQAETNAGAVSQGGYASATSQIVSPYPAFQNPVYQPPAQNETAQAPQQQITQYFQQPSQNPVVIQQQPTQQPVQQWQQPAQQVLPVQQVIQPVQPIIQPTIMPPVPAQPAAQEAQTNQQVTNPVQTTSSPLQINIPIEVKPIVSSEPIVIPVPRTSEPAAPVAPAPGPAAPIVPAIAPVMAAAPPAAAPVVKPNTIYRIQVGSFKEARNALAAFDRLKGAGFSPVYERNGEYFRVVLAGVPSNEVNGILQKIITAGFANPLLREER